MDRILWEEEELCKYGTIKELLKEWRSNKT
jgi:hypothetical protein